MAPKVHKCSSDGPASCRVADAIHPRIGTGSRTLHRRNPRHPSIVIAVGKAVCVGLVLLILACIVLHLRRLGGVRRTLISIRSLASKMPSKRDSRQLPLFLRPTPPPCSLDPLPEEIRLCSGCGKQIITRRRTAEGEIVSEYCYQTGRYWGCAHARP